MSIPDISILALAYELIKDANLHSLLRKVPKQINIHKVNVKKREKSKEEKEENKEEIEDGFEEVKKSKKKRHQDKMLQQEVKREEEVTLIFKH